mgnify:CR=1 FL=1
MKDWGGVALKSSCNDNALEYFFALFIFIAYPSSLFVK